MPAKTPRPFSHLLDDLDGIYDEIWSTLQRAVENATHGWHLPVVGTESAGRANMRIVVLRAADPLQGTLAFHTDRRSEKIAQIEANPHVSWNFYDQSMRVQVQIDTTAQVHSDDALADERWHASRLESRRCYLAPYPPGQAVVERTFNLPESLRDRPPTETEAVAGREHFVVVSAQVHAINWLYLNAAGNLGARFQIENAKRVESTWVTA